jgi:hypothetical protein
MDNISIFYLTMEEMFNLLLPTNPGTPPGQREKTDAHHHCGGLAQGPLHSPRPQGASLRL